MEERKWTCLSSIIIDLYIWVIISDLFSQENYKIHPYIVDDIASLVVIWLIPIIVFFPLFRNQNIREKLLSNRRELIALALIFLAGISHKILSIVYSLIIPVDMVNSFRYESSTERVVFVILQTSILAVKILGFALALQFGIKQVSIKNQQNRNRSGILVFVMFISFIAFLIQDIKALLPFYGY